MTGEAPLLTEIAVTAKAHWGYPPEWMRSFEPLLRLTEEYLVRHRVLVAEAESQAVGFCALEDHGDEWVLEHLWVDPSWHRRGVGRALWTQAIETVRALRPGKIVLHSDPNAAGFYRRMGATEIGAVASPIEGDPERTVPVFEVRPLEDGFRLDRLWYTLRGGVACSKESDLTLLAEILARVSTPYAVIGGIALQIHRQDPRTTLDIEVALISLQEDLRTGLLDAGFQEQGGIWLGPEGTPVQFTDDPVLHGAIPRAIEVRLGDVGLRVLAKSDLLHEKLRAGKDPARRRSKRLQDLADAQALLEQDPGLRDELTPDERALLEQLPD
jgi:GNAT superfamily N-acetyltransferase